MPPSYRAPDPFPRLTYATILDVIPYNVCRDQPYIFWNRMSRTLHDTKIFWECFDMKLKSYHKYSNTFKEKIDRIAGGLKRRVTKKINICYKRYLTVIPNCLLYEPKKGSCRWNPPKAPKFAERSKQFLNRVVVMSADNTTSTKCNCDSTR